MLIRFFKRFRLVKYEFLYLHRDGSPPHRDGPFHTDEHYLRAMVEACLNSGISFGVVFEAPSQHEAERIRLQKLNAAAEEADQ
jgi:hypothetical protein